MASDQRTGPAHGREPVADEWVSRLDPAGPMKRIRDGLVFSSAYIAIIAALEVVMVMLVLDLAAPMAAVMVGCVTFTIYGYDRVIDLEADELAASRRTAFVRRHRRTLSGLAAVAYGAAVAIAALGGPLATALVLFPGAVWILYAVDWAPEWFGSVRRLKDLVVVGSLFVAVAWGVTVVLAPVAVAGAAITPTVWVLVGYFAVGTFVGAEVSNVRDRHADVADGVDTLPTALGVGATKWILTAVLLAGLALLWLGHSLGALGLTASAALSVGILAMGGVVAALGRLDRDASLAIYGECARLPSLLALLVAVGLG
jgi:4-hydroxybenzoate polyprenyltransferase